MRDQLLKEYIESILENERLSEGVFDNVMSYVKEKGAVAKEKLKVFIEDLKRELEETGAGAMMLQKMVMGEDLDPQEMTFLKDQAKDVAKGLPLLGLFALPGGGLATVALVKAAKKFNIDLMPSSFNKEEEIIK